ncbi:MAG: transcriptional repressor [Candidatus Neomarinimicrobiota bacterium]
MKTYSVLKEALKDSGLRYTRQRQAVWDELCSTSDHRDAEDIYVTLVHDGLPVSRATVYRTIEVLVKKGLARKLDIGDGRSRYEMRLENSHHDHMICVNCGKIEEFVDLRIEELQEDVAKRHGYILNTHNLQLYGLCGDCQ